MPNTERSLTLGLYVYNGEDHVGDVLEDVFAQTYGDFELIISDNASTDGTSDLWRDYASRDRRVRYHRNPRNMGLGPNFNRVFELSSTRYFKWLSHDDRHAPTFLERCIQVLESDPGVVVSHTDTGMIGEHEAPLPYNKTRRTYVDPRGSGSHWTHHISAKARRPSIGFATCCTR